MSYFRNYNKILPILSSKHSSITSLISAYTKGTLQNLQARVTPTEGGLKIYPTRITALHLRYSICHVQLPKSLWLWGPPSGRTAMSVLPSGNKRGKNTMGLNLQVMKWSLVWYTNSPTCFHEFICVKGPMEKLICSLNHCSMRQVRMMHFKIN